MVGRYSLLLFSFQSIDLFSCYLQVFHPCIDSEGKMSLDILRENDWRWISDCMKMETLLESIVSALYDPLLDFPINDDIADPYFRYNSPRAIAIGPHVSDTSDPHTSVRE
jgi:hypothetical protein